MSDNPFDEAPSEGAGNRHGFGLLKVIVNNVELETGAYYTVPGINNAQGEPFQFRGKKLNKQSKNRHVILSIQKNTKSGDAYTTSCDFMYWKNDDVCKVAEPALRAVLGDKLKPGVSFPVEYEEVSVKVKGRDKDVLTFKLVKLFKNAAEMETARETYFSKFAGNGAEAKDSAEPTFETGIPDGYTADSWKAMADELLTKYQTHVQTLSGKPPEKRKAALKYIASEEAGSTPEQLAELIGV